MSGDTPTLTSEIARVVHLGYVADEYAHERNEPDAVSDAAGDLGDDLRQLGGRLRFLVDELEAKHRAEVERLDMLNKVETAVRVKAQAEVERLAATSDDLRTEADSLGGLYKGAVRHIERLTRERDESIAREGRAVESREAWRTRSEQADGPRLGWNYAKPFEGADGGDQ